MFEFFENANSKEKTCVTIDYFFFKKGRLMWCIELLPIAVLLVRVLNAIPHATAATFINSDSFDINILASKFTNIKK